MVFVQYQLVHGLHLTVRKKDGGEYEPNSLRFIISSVDRKLKRMKYGFTILGEGSKSNGVFNLTRDAISAKQRNWRNQFLCQNFMRYMPHIIY
jgi:hypothetical protein